MNESSILLSRMSPALAVAVWRLTGVPLDELLHGKLATVPGGAP